MKRRVFKVKRNGHDVSSTKELTAIDNALAKKDFDYDIIDKMTPFSVLKTSNQLVPLGADKYGRVWAEYVDRLEKIFDPTARDS